MRRWLSAVRLTICFTIIAAVFNRAAAQQLATIRVASGDSASVGAIDGTVVDTSGASLALVEAVSDHPVNHVSAV